MRRFPLVLLILCASLLAVGCGEYGNRYVGETNAASDTEEAKITDEKFTPAVQKRDGCTKLEEFESEGSQHTVENATDKGNYKHNPPHSGNHYQVAAEWGLYDSEQPDVQTLHNMEHGHIVISHKGLSAKQQDKLLAQARKNPFHLLVQPRKKNPKNGVYYMAWTVQLYCKQPSAAALQHMIEEWRDQGPELFTDDASGGSMGV